MPLQRSRSGRAGPPSAEPLHREPLSSGPFRQKAGLSTTPGRKGRQYGENQPPENANIAKEAASPGLHKTASKKLHGNVGSPALPPMPPSVRPSPAQAGPLPASGAFFDSVARRKLSWDAQPASGTEVPPSSAQLAGGSPVIQTHVPDNGVKVIVRVRPLTHREEQEEEIEALCIASQTISLAQQTFTFDAVAGPDASQHDLFNMVGVPMLDNCFAGFNSSIFAYGQTGSGKTYTMWGTTEEPARNLPPSENRGVAPRLFEQLFVRIQQEEIRHAADQLRYQCRCSFLEIYNEQITDLLEPSQKNLQIREDTKTGVYVENLTEEYVSGVNDISQLLLKGLANRRVGSTMMNNESSRSHSVFTCVIECRFKSLEQGVSSIRSSRMNLVDLAGSERQKQTGAAGERLKEAANINRSLSQLGNVINILAEVAQSGKQRHIPYRDSRLTFLLQESLGGNAKLAMICALSIASSCRSETLSTLRFAKRAKAIQNKAVVNEETANDVKLLREQIRQLKDELMRMKGNDAQQPSGWNPRRSYNLLRMSLSHPMVFAKGDMDPSDEEMEIEEDDDMEIDDDNVEVNHGRTEMVGVCNAEGLAKASSLGPISEDANGDQVFAVSTESGMVVEMVCSIQESGSQDHINSNGLQYLEHIHEDPVDTVLRMGDGRGEDDCARSPESGQVVNMLFGIQEPRSQEGGSPSAVQQALDSTASDLIVAEGYGNEVCAQLADSGSVVNMICPMEPECQEQGSTSDLVQESTLERLSIAVSRDQPFYDCRSVFDSCSLLTPNGSISFPRNQQSMCGSSPNFEYLEIRRLESPMQTESPRIGNLRALDDGCSSQDKSHYASTPRDAQEVKMQALTAETLADTSQHGLPVTAAGSPLSQGQETEKEVDNGVDGCAQTMLDPVPHICRNSAEYGHSAGISLVMESDCNAKQSSRTVTSPGTSNSLRDDGPVGMAAGGESPIMQCEPQPHGLGLESPMQTGSPIISKHEEGTQDFETCQSEALEPDAEAAVQNILLNVADNVLATEDVDLCQLETLLLETPDGQQSIQAEVVDDGLASENRNTCQLDAVLLETPDGHESALPLRNLPLQAEVVDDGFATNELDNNCRLEALPMEPWDSHQTALAEQIDQFQFDSGLDSEALDKFGEPLLETPDVHQSALSFQNYPPVGDNGVAGMAFDSCQLEALALETPDVLQSAEAMQNFQLESGELDPLPAESIVTSHGVAVGEWPASVDWKNVSKPESVVEIEKADDGNAEADNYTVASDEVLQLPSPQVEALVFEIPSVVHVENAEAVNSWVATEEVLPLPSPKVEALLFEIPSVLQVGNAGVNCGVATEDITPPLLEREDAFSFEIPTVVKVSKGVQTSPVESGKWSNELEERRSGGESMWQMVAVEESTINLEKPQTQLNKAVEALLAGAIRREESAEEKVRRQAAEIEQLNRLIRQYKHERECNAILQQSREDKIARLESLMDGVLPSDAFLNHEWAALTNEHQVLLDKYDNHPEVTHSIIQQQRLIEELREYRDFFNLGEKEDMQKEIRQLRKQLQAFLESGPPPRPLDSRRRSMLMQSISVRQSLSLRQSMCIRNSVANPSPLGLCPDPMRFGESIGKLSDDLTMVISEEFNDEDLQGDEMTPLVMEQGSEKHRPPVEGGYLPVTQTRSLDEREMEWEERENDWMAVLEELRLEVDSYRRQAEMRTHELECERRCSEEVREALQMAMTGHARVLDQYAELQEKHISILAKHRKIRDGAADVKKMGKRSGVDSRWLESQAAKMTLMEAEHEEERQAMKEEIASLRAQLNDTGEAVQAAGELLVRLREAEEAICIAQDAASLAEQDADALQRELEKTKRKHGTEIATLHQRLLEARLQKSTLCQMCVMAERVKFEFTEVDEKTAQAEMEAEQRAAELKAAACSDFPEQQLVESPVRSAPSGDDWDYESPPRDYDPAAEFQYDYHHNERVWRR